MNLKFVSLIMVLLVLAPLAQAGTLISGSKVDVVSNYEGFNGLNLLGTWSTTPAVSDEIIIVLGGVEPPYDVTNTVRVQIPQSVFEQVFRVLEQQPLYRATLVEKSYFYLNLPGGQTAAQLCEEKFLNDLATTYSNRQLYPGTGANALIGNAGCDAIFVLLEEHKGWIGNVYHDSWNYKQDIKFSNGQSLRLETSEDRQQVVDKIDNFARATLLNFGTWTNAKLTDKNVYAYHLKSGSTPGSLWKPFSDTQGLGTYINQDAYLRSKFESGSLGLNDFDSASREAYRTAVNILNNEAFRLSGKSGTAPSTWFSNGDVSQMRVVANDIVVPIKRTILTANIQLLLKGDKFGLFIPVGEPEIVSLASSITFEETGSGYLDYTVRNKGDATGTFSIRGTCGNTLITTDEQLVSLTSKQSKTGKLLHTARTDITSDQTSQCTFIMEETQTKQQATRSYSVTVKAKQSCVEGQETDPKIDGNEFVVQVLDTQCNVKSEKRCDALTKKFEKQNGVWVCIDKDDPSSGDDAGDDDGDQCKIGGLEVFGKTVGGVPAPKFFCEKDIGLTQVLGALLGIIVMIVGFIVVANVKKQYKLKIHPGLIFAVGVILGIMAYFIFVALWWVAVLILIIMVIVNVVINKVLGAVGAK